MKNEQEMAYALYTEYGLAADSIAKYTEVPAETINKWIRDFGWQDIVATNNMAPGRLVSEYYRECSNIINDARRKQRRLTDDEVSRMSKLVNTANKLDYEQSPRVQMEVLMKYMDYLLIHNTALAKEVAVHAMDYARHLMKRTKKMSMKSKKN